MKNYFVCIFLICAATHTSKAYQPFSCEQPTFQDYKEAIIRARKKRSTHEYQWSLALAAALGGISGYLCRHVEQKTLNDFLPLRLLNLLIWGAAQESIIKTIAQDLNGNTTNRKLFAKLAWLTSWISYFLH